VGVKGVESLGTATRTEAWNMAGLGYSSLEYTLTVIDKSCASNFQYSAVPPPSYAEMIPYMCIIEFRIRIDCNCQFLVLNPSRIGIAAFSIDLE